MQYAVLSWSLHLAYHYTWADTIDQHFETMIRLRDRHGLQSMGFDFGIGNGDNQILSRDSGYLAELRRRMEAEGFTPIVGCGALQIHADRNLYEQSLQAVAGCFGTAASLGAPVARFIPVFHGRVSDSGRKRLFIEAANRLAGAAQEYGLKICSENYESFRLDDFEEILPQIDPQYGILNDIGNWLILGTDPYTGLASLIDRTIHVHLKDYRLVDGIWRSVVLGEGIVDVPRCLKLLRSSSWDPKICSVELDLDEGDEFDGIDKCLSYLVGLGQQ